MLEYTIPLWPSTSLNEHWWRQTHPQEGLQVSVLLTFISKEYDEMYEMPDWTTLEIGSSHLPDTPMTSMSMISADGSLIIAGDQ